MQNIRSKNHGKATLGNLALWNLLVVVIFWLHFIHLVIILNNLQITPVLYPDTVKVKFRQ
jgi:hypothetical protein